MCELCAVSSSRRDFLRLLASAPLAAALPGAASAATGISDYRAAFSTVLAEDGRLFIITRRFVQDGTHMTLAVDPVNLETMIRPEVSLTPVKEDWPTLRESPFVSALWALTSAPYPTENAGLTHARGNVDGYFLTVDMCPSHKPFEAGFFRSLSAEAERGGKPMPVAISISGYWAIDHEVEFASIIEQQRRGEIDVTWVNHSYTHRYLRGVPDRENFMLMPHTDLEREVFRTEELMIAKGLTPSVFFRFPGLVADAYLVMELRRLCLIPLGADAWLAKGKRPRAGSIILVHGNGNEPQGIHDVRPYLADRHVHWMGLREAVVSA